MVPMPMAPYQGFDLALVHASLFKNFINVLRDVQAWDGSLDEVVDRRCKVPPVLPAP